jgi:acetyl esterase
MPLDPQAKLFLDRLTAVQAPAPESLPVPLARASFAAMIALGGPPAPVARVETRAIPGNIMVRVYRPEGLAPGPSPALVYFHGGGWVLGGLETVDGPCRRLAAVAKCLIVSVAYRLAPEHRFPIPVEDAFAATRYLAGQAEAFGVDRDRIAVGGDSAGGNLAAAVALLAGQRSGPHLTFQLLFYPVTNHAFDTPSYREFAEGYLLTRRAMQWYWSHYLPRPEDGDKPAASPLRARHDDLRGLPPALVMTAEFDPLRDEGEAYADRLLDAGVRVQTHRQDGLIHGFLQFGGIIDRARTALDEGAAALRAALGP